MFQNSFVLCMCKLLHIHSALSIECLDAIHYNRLAHHSAYFSRMMC